MRTIIAVLLASSISGCSTWYVLSDMNELNAHIQNLNKAGSAASVRLDDMCIKEPKTCRMRLWRTLVPRDSANMKPSIEERLRSPLYSRRLLPPYRTIWAVLEEEARKHTQARIAEEYVLGVGRMIADLIDDEKISEEAGMAICEKAGEQRVEMIKQDIRMLQESYVVAQQQDRATLDAFTSLVSLSANGINAYAAARFPARVRVPSQPTIVAPNLYSATDLAPASIVRCTHRLNALAGMMLCVTIDGRVFAQ